MFNILISCLTAVLFTGCIRIYSSSKNSIKPEANSVEKEIRAGRFKRINNHNYKILFKDGRKSKYASIVKINQDSVYFISNYGIKIIPLDEIQEIRFKNKVATHTVNGALFTVYIWGAGIILFLINI